MHRGHRAPHRATVPTVHCQRAPYKGSRHPKTATESHMGDSPPTTTGPTPRDSPPCPQEHSEGSTPHSGAQATGALPTLSGAGHKTRSLHCFCYFLRDSLTAHRQFGTLSPPHPNGIKYCAAKFQDIHQRVPERSGAALQARSFLVPPTLSRRHCALVPGTVTGLDTAPHPVLALRDALRGTARAPQHG